MSSISFSSSSVFSRRLSLSDLVYAASGYRQLDENQLISQIVVEGTGAIGEGQLQSAIERIVVAMPASRLRLRGFWRLKHWRGDGLMPVVRTLDREWDGQWQPGLDFIDTPLDLVRGPVAEIVQVRGTKTYLVFRVHHAVMDGVGLVEFVVNLFRILRGETPQNFHSPVVLEHLPEGNPALSTKPPRQAATPLQIVTNSSDAVDRTRIWKRVTIPGRDSRILLRTILALGKIAATNSADPVRLHVPVNLRRHLQDQATSANLVGMLRLDLAPDETLRSLVKKFSLQLEQRQELPYAVRSVSSRAMFWIPLWLLRLLERKLMAGFFRQPRFRFSGTVSSLGVIDPEQCCVDGFRAESAFGIPVHPLGSPLFAVIVSNDKGTEIVLSAANALITKNELDLLAEKLYSRLTDTG